MNVKPNTTQNVQHDALQEQAQTNALDHPQFLTVELPDGKVHFGDNPGVLAGVKKGKVIHTEQLARFLPHLALNPPNPLAFLVREVALSGSCPVHFESPEFEANAQGELHPTVENLEVLQKLLDGAFEALKMQVQNLIKTHPTTPLLDLPFLPGKVLLTQVLKNLGHQIIHTRVWTGSTLMLSEQYGWIPSGRQPLKWAGQPLIVGHPGLQDQVNALFLQGKTSRPAICQEGGSLPDFENPEPDPQSTPLIVQVPELHINGTPMPYLVLHDELRGDGPLLVTTLSVEDTLTLMASDTEEGHNLLGQVSMALMHLEGFPKEGHHDEKSTLPSLRHAVLGFAALTSMMEDPDFAKVEFHFQQAALHLALQNLQAVEPSSIPHLPTEAQSALKDLQTHTEQVREALQSQLQ